MKKLGTIIIIIGLLLIGGALALFLRNENESNEAGQMASNVIESMREQTAETRKSSESNKEDELPTVRIGDYDYIGYIKIPDIDRELPVISLWDGDYDKLKIAPCRQFGSPLTNDLVIAAHNYRSHFARLHRLELGASVIFTDISGVDYNYEVAAKDVIEPTDIDAIQNSGYDLVLYTCTYKADTRVTIFCNRVDEG